MSQLEAFAPDVLTSVEEDPRQRWETPDPLGPNLVAGFGCTVDAAAHAGNALCPRFYSREDSALARDWPTDEVIWCNPPFRIASKFGERAIDCMERGGCVVMLVIDRGAQWLEEALARATWWRFTGRVEYRWPADAPPRDKKNGVTFGSVLVLFDDHRPPGFAGWRDHVTGREVGPP